MDGATRFLLVSFLQFCHFLDDDVQLALQFVQYKSQVIDVSVPVPYPQLLQTLNQ